MRHVAGIRLHNGEELRKIAPWQCQCDGSFSKGNLWGTIWDNSLIKRLMKWFKPHPLKQGLNILTQENGLGVFQMGLHHSWATIIQLVVRRSTWTLWTKNHRNTGENKNFMVRMSLHSIQKAVVQPHHNDSAIVSLGSQKDLPSFLLHLSRLHMWWWEKC